MLHLKQHDPIVRLRQQLLEQGWYRHITLCMLAHAFLVVLRTQSQMEDRREDEEKKPWKPCLPHSPSQSLSAFKRQRGLTCP